MIEVTSMSSRGQIVIPQEIRQQLDLKIGEKFFVVAADDAVILRRIDPPTFKDMDRLLKKTRAFVKERGITQKDLNHAIKRSK